MFAIFSFLPVNVSTRAAAAASVRGRARRQAGRLLLYSNITSLLFRTPFLLGHSFGISSWYIERQLLSKKTLCNPFSANRRGDVKEWGVFAPRAPHERPGQRT